MHTYPPHTSTAGKIYLRTVHLSSELSGKIIDSLFARISTWILHSEYAFREPITRDWHLAFYWNARTLVSNTKFAVINKLPWKMHAVFGIVDLLAFRLIFISIANGIGKIFINFSRLPAIVIIMKKLAEQSFGLCGFSSSRATWKLTQIETYTLSTFFHRLSFSHHLEWHPSVDTAATPCYMSSLKY